MLRKIRSVFSVVLTLAMYPLSIYLTNQEIVWLMIHTQGPITQWLIYNTALWFIWTIIQCGLLIMLLHNTILRKSKAELAAEAIRQAKEKEMITKLFESRKNEIQREMEKAKVESIIITPKPVTKDPGVQFSKFGGKPYWPKGKDFPVSKAGNRLKLLAQFNLSDLPKNKLLPENGLLQFYISTESYEFGMNGDYAVIFHETIKPELLNNDAADKDLQHIDDRMPVRGIFSLEFTLGMEYPDGASDVFDSILGKVLSDAYILDNPSAINMIKYLHDKYPNLVDSKDENKIGGYQLCVQFDRRPKNSVLLFQMVSLFGRDVLPKTHEIMWGDAGACYFYIDAADLAERKFENTSYGWDCY